MGLEEDCINDLGAFFDTDGFADTAWYNGSSFAVQFYSEYEASIIYGTEIENAAPYFLAQDTDISGIAHGDRITVGTAAPADGSFQSDADGVFISDADGEFDESGQMDYLVIGIEPDGLGMTKIIMQKE